MQPDVAVPRIVLVTGSGGREHALAWRLALDEGVARVIVTPGNPGMSDDAEVRPGVDPRDAEAVRAVARETGAELVVIGPEAPLASGLADGLRGAGLHVFGPGAAGARLEASKSFCRAVAGAAGVPIAAGEAFSAVAPALEFAARFGGRVVVKADGLAAGKGVTVCERLDEAEEALRASLEGGRFGAAGLRVVVEERLEGREVSLIALCDETAVLALPAARDHKRIGEGERGPNTGGMGAYSPVEDCDDATAAELVRRIHGPVLAELARRGIGFRGALYAGLMLTGDGPRLLEFNVRLGDPEAQALLPRLAIPLAPLLLAAAAGRLREAAAALDLRDGLVPAAAESAVAVVLAAPGYPGTPRLGGRIEGLDAARASGALVFAAGVAADQDGRLVTAGGRVLAVVGRGPTAAAAAETAYAGVARVAFPGRQVRRDIGPPAGALRSSGAGQAAPGGAALAIGSGS
ncbi:MAG: phosphoribosylamine--glycine ligase [Candidatus Limnocylindrales bacterium]